jgi:site-specific recombinase XerD
MFDTLFSDWRTIARHRDGPFVVERERYLRYNAAVGASLLTQTVRARALLLVARTLTAGDVGKVGAERLGELIGSIRPSPAPATATNLVNSARPWFKFLGWWHVPARPTPFAAQLDAFVAWMRDERGLAPCTVEQWRYRTANFLRWCGHTGRELSALTPEDVDAYFVTYGATRWSRVSAGYIAKMLRVFFRHAASQGTCPANLADSILSHRRYRLEALPYAVDWSDVRRLIASASGATEVALRDRAILLLLAVYGLRRGEVAALRIEHVDFDGWQLRIERLKRRQPQIYPLVASVALALARYIEEARPAVDHRAVFIRAQAPRLPISPACVYDIVSRRLRSLNVKAVHLGPHVLRHACASKLLADGLTLKEIGDHLGHRSTSSTSIYTKVDLASLREVGDFDLGGLQ